MKKILILILSLATFSFANSTYGKIDMHGGKQDSLINNSNSFKKKNFNSFSNSFTKDNNKKELKRKNNKNDKKKKKKD
ncbi:hypothetical protein [Arcobacter sp. CECT 8985]|uniref:hypothetical protein n=1 Tax=Arcobacter sp. CECT 8985 TaxID=1935424 RepID=UPI00100AACBA|nr:hypothetical protein [Arcobacter sp. CECT 8985]RXJ86684.1 hypothetical protein CRU93_07670 [Arcobacter sp. CECT 8985]